MNTSSKANHFLRIIFSVFFLWNCNYTYAQEITSGQERDTFHRLILPLHPKEDSLQLQSLVNEKLGDLHKAGFLDAALDSVYADDDGNSVLLFNKGASYKYKVRRINQPLPIIPASVLHQATQVEGISFPEFENLTKYLLTQFSESGFPFSKIEKENIEFDKNIIFKDITIYPGEKFVFGTLEFEGNVLLNESFVANFLGIRKGGIYNERLINEAPQKFADLDFMRLTGPIQVSYSPGKANIKIPAQRTSPGRFDGIAGISGGGDPQIPVILTGQLGLFLSNVFRSGESLDFRWQGAGNGTQSLHMNGYYPYPASLPVHTDLLFTLHKQDTSWLELQLKPNLLFPFGNRNMLGVYWHHANNFLLGNNQEASTIASSLQPFSFNLYGLQYRYRTRGYFTEFQKPGTHIIIEASAGRRKITHDTSRGSAQVLVSNSDGTSFITMNGNLETKTPLGIRSLLVTGLAGAYISGNSIPVNQHFRLGGFKSLKGFDELSIVAVSYLFPSVEFRFFIGSTSYFSAFANGGWYEQKTSIRYLSDFPYGFGLGLNQQTAAGIFSIILASGFSNTSSSGWRNTKIHIGYLSNF